MLSTFKFIDKKEPYIKIISPELYTSKKTVEFIVETAKSAVQCTLSPTEAGLDDPTVKKFVSTQNNKLHKAGTITFEIDAQYTYWVKCIFAGSDQKRNFDFIIDTTPPKFISIKDGEITDKLKSLSASWEFEDNASKIEGYEYSIGTAKGEVNVLNWSATKESSVTLDKLNLSNNTIYYWNVRAQNKAGLWSSVHSSDGVKVDTSNSKDIYIDPGEGDICFNGVQDEGEVGIDCGGDCEELCSVDSYCETDIDCSSGKCVNNICVAATCSDNLLNQEESDIDCGGSCIGCSIGQSCNVHADCASNYCSLGVCSEASCTDGVYNGNEQGVDCGGNCPVCDYEEFEEDEGDSDLSEEGENKKPSMVLIMLVLLLFIVAAGGGYYYYQYIYLPQQRGSPTSQTDMEPIFKPLQRPIRRIKESLQKKQMSKEELSKKHSIKQKQRESLVSKFDDNQKDKSENKPENKPADESQNASGSNSQKESDKQPENSTDKSAGKIMGKPAVKSSVFDKLKEVSSDKAKAKGKDVFKELEKVKNDKK